MNTIGELLMFLATFLEGVEQKDSNKHYKRFMRLVQSLFDHLKQEGFTEEALETFDAKYSKNKAEYGQKGSTSLSAKTKEKLNILIEELADIKKMMEHGEDDYAVEIKVLCFIKNSALSVLDGTFCKKQQELLKKLKTKTSAAELAA